MKSLALVKFRYMSKSIEDRFFGKIRGFSLPSMCIEWDGATNHDGYGLILIKGEKIIYVHRLSWELHNGPIPEDKNVLHSCDNRPCIRPDHLFLGTQADNVKDMMKKERNRHCPGELNGRARLTNANVKEIWGFLGAGATHKKIADYFGCSEPAIWQISQGRTWKHITAQG
jgi:hypothetical protein